MSTEIADNSASIGRASYADEVGRRAIARYVQRIKKTRRGPLKLPACPAASHRPCLSPKARLQVKPNTGTAAVKSYWIKC